MKMIAATKMNRALKAMEVARNYYDCSRKSFTNFSPDAEERIIHVICSSDRGLCGGVHSSLAKYTRKLVDKRRDPNTTHVITLGDKVKNQLSKSYSANILRNINQIGKSIPTFNDSENVASTLFLEKERENASISLIFNKFKSALAFETSQIMIPKMSLDDLKKAFLSYEFEEDVIQDFYLFYLCNTVFISMMESHTSEMSSRRMSMDNATKNASEIVNRLTLKYNRTRQAVITNELVDIITGASAL